MKKTIKTVLGVLIGSSLLFATTAFIISDPTPDFVKKDISQTDLISLSKIDTDNEKIGSFKSSVEFNHNNSNRSTKEFYGQEILISENPRIDRILIGITNNLITRIEIWKANKLIESKEVGFMDKMTWGETQSLTVEFYDQTYKKYKGHSKISMRFYNGSGFFGDIGTINIDLTKYGDLSGDKSIRLFAKSMTSKINNSPKFSDLKIWKNYLSFD
jgi:hypothetical protein